MSFAKFNASIICSKKLKILYSLFHSKKRRKEKKQGLFYLPVGTEVPISLS